MKSAISFLKAPLFLNKKPLKFQRFEWWSVGGSNSQAIAEHVEMKGGQHAISFHPTTHPTTCCSSTNGNLQKLCLLKQFDFCPVLPGRSHKKEFRIIYYKDVLFQPFYVEKNATFSVTHIYTLSKQSFQYS